MVEIGGRPILWHIMMYYSHYGFNNFAIALGYKGEVIKKYMVDYCSLNSNLTVNLKTGIVERHGGYNHDWTVDLADTGITTNTGGRIKRLAPYIGNHDGTPWRSIVHIEDISRAFIAVLHAPRQVVHNQAFNVGRNEDNYRIRELAEIVEETVPGCSIEYAKDAGPEVDLGRF